MSRATEDQYVHYAGTSDDPTMEELPITGSGDRTKC
jgi:hypothetical protein